MLAEFFLFRTKKGVRYRCFDSIEVANTPHNQAEAQNGSAES